MEIVVQCFKLTGWRKSRLQTLLIDLSQINLRTQRERERNHYLVVASSKGELCEKEDPVQLK